MPAVRRIARWGLSADRCLPVRGRCPENQIIRAVASAAKHSPIGATCLATALVGQALMNRHGHSCEFRIGVRREDSGKFAAHAWLERDGKVILNGPGTFVSLYTRLPELEHLIQ
jgi:hypothetical protein